MKAQMWSMDFVVSVTMFFIAVIMILFAWDYTASENYEQITFNEMQSKGLIVSDVLVRTGGSPSDWNETAMAIGLVSEENIIDEDRLRNFIFYMDYNDSKGIMGIRNYDYYFTMKNLDNETMQLDSQNIEKGNSPSTNVNMIVPVQRYVIFQEEIAKIDFILWS